MKSSGPGQTEFEMRGLASVGGNSAVVGFYLDEVPLSAPGGQFNGRVVIDPNLYDLNRVEVLRGPQGTLYGSSSMGGTVKVVTNAPDPNKWAAMLFVDNIGNKQALLDDVLQYNIDVPTFQRGTVTQPRTIGADFSYHFGK
jgi:iron complex outermembrane recepter protein